MKFESDSSYAAPLSVVASIHNEVSCLLLDQLRRLREVGEYDHSVVSNALKLVKDEGIAAFAETSPYNLALSKVVSENSDLFEEVERGFSSDSLRQSCLKK